MSHKRQEDDFWPLVVKLVNSSELKYKDSDFKGSMDDKIKERRIIKGKSNTIGIEKNFNKLIRESRSGNPKYDLINDYKRRITESKRLEIIASLENISQDKYQKGEYKAAIRALRRAEKYL